MAPLFMRAVIIGTGLIGGSIGMGLRHYGLAAEVVGVARRRSTLRRAKRAGAIDRGMLDCRQAVSRADLVVLAAPVRTIEKLLTQHRSDFPAGCVLFDVGSTKADIVAQAERLLPPPVHFVGAHPLAGAEKNGVEHGRQDLFSGAACILTPTPRTDARVLRTVESLWRRLGAKTYRLAPADHDAAVAQISHLPHLLSAALVASVSRAALPFAASGFRDTTRIAAGDPLLWRDIIFTNRRCILNAVRALEKTLGTLRRAIQAGDEPAVVDFLTRAKQIRDSLPGGGRQP
ncbi:MAG: prephenate dehydrogenase [Candidatus Omnitrophica bacterium]|nr:prephenate dehydrogenase [Candidatus Omnitrophota bacterium]